MYHEWKKKQNVCIKKRIYTFYLWNKLEKNFQNVIHFDFIKKLCINSTLKKYYTNFIKKSYDVLN